MKPYITPDEACKLSEGLTVQDMKIASSIYEQSFYNDLQSLDTIQPVDKRSAHLCSLAAVFNAGRIAGIRQERERRKAQATCHNEKYNLSVSLDKG